MLAIWKLYWKSDMEFHGGSAGEESGIVSAVAWVAAGAGVQSLARELAHAVGTAPQKEYI